MIKIDLHTHSMSSPDGGITAAHYKKAVKDRLLDCIAITDHDTIDFALKLHSELGKQIIVGEEISTAEGDLVGLFLSQRIEPNQSALKTAQDIKKQGGVVYIPHPFETIRRGLSQKSLHKISELIDIVEVYNGRAVFQNKGPQATSWAKINNKATAASSDAHGYKGLGTTYTVISDSPEPDNLVKLLRTAQLVTKRPPFYTLFYPKAHKLMKWFGK